MSEDFTTWLEEHGLSNYEATVGENGIDFRPLPKLTERVLTDFGVLLGHPRHSTALPQLELARRVVPAKESRCESHVGLALPSSRSVRC